MNVNYKRLTVEWIKIKGVRTILIVEHGVKELLLHYKNQTSNFGKEK